MKRSAVLIGLLVVVMVFVQTLVAASSEPEDLLRDQGGVVQEIVGLLEKGNEQHALDKLDSLHSAVVETRASLQGLTFEGEGKTDTRTRVTDPFELPSGTYRIHFTTPETGSVKLFPLEEDSYELLFNLFGSGQAEEGASVVYRSSGGKVVLEISNVSAPYKLIFEKLG